MHTDPIADMLTRIRNGQAVKKTEIVLPYSKLKMDILMLLSYTGWLGNIEKLVPFEHQANKNKKETKRNLLSRFANIKVQILYNSSGKPKITSLKRISKPGCRIYVDKNNIPRILNDLGMAVISTSQGLMTNKEAREKKIGGEAIMEIY